MATKELKLAEMSSLSIGTIVDTLSNAYITLINNNIPFKTFPSGMLWGQPGVGKSQAIEQIRQNIENATGKITKVKDVRLLLFNPVDLRGIPVPNAERTFAKWLAPDIFLMDPSSDVVNILFLDEISAAPQSVQSAAYQITLDRKVGELMLPDNCIVIAAGNRVTDKSVAYKMPKALANRFMHFEVKSDYKSWQKWAIEKGIHPIIQGFLNERNELLNTFDSSNDVLAFATPRSWEMVSNILNNIDENIDHVYSLVCGLIGTGIASELRSYSKYYNKLPKVKDIVNGKMPPLPTDPSIIYMLCCSIINYCRNVGEEIPSTELINIAYYMREMPKDFSFIICMGLYSISEEFKKRLFNIPEFSKLLGDKVSVFNGL